MSLASLAAPPFALDAEALSWVEATFARLSPDARLAQLFVLRSGLDAAGFGRLVGFRPGGMTAVFGRDWESERRNIDRLISASEVPPLVSADLEGSRMSLPFGAEVLNPLGLAAVDDVAATAEISRIMAEEARAVGINWTFTPVVDVNAAFRSAIVGTRGFGSDVDRIERHALAEIAVFQRHGIAATAKHWPGEGFDDRDQHLVTTINPLSMEAWEQTFGRLYRSAIRAGVLAVMSGHIALPAYVRAVEPGAGLEAFRPASVSRRLNLGLLRDRLGFNGLIVSDATGMGGLGAWGPRSQTIPDILAGGGDVILFSDDPGADVAAIKVALADGRLSAARVDDAVMRVLGFKAALGLHRPASERLPPPVPDKAAHQAIATGIARRAPTLVKDTQALLPLDPRRHRRIRVVTPGIVLPFLPEPLPFALPDMLRARGFEVTLHQPGMALGRDAADVVLFLFGDESLLARSHIFVDWLKLGGNVVAAMERIWHDVPSLIVSFGHPYLLYDAPRVPTYVNAYATIETVQQAVADLLVGEAAWSGKSPVDPFCGLEDARY